MTASSAQIKLISDIRTASLARVADADSDIRDLVTVLVSMDESECITTREVSFLIDALKAVQGVALRWDVGGLSREARPEVYARTRAELIAYLRDLITQSEREDSYSQGALGRYLNWDEDYTDAVKAALSATETPATSGQADEVRAVRDLAARALLSTRKVNISEADTQHPDWIAARAAHESWAWMVELDPRLDDKTETADLLASPLVPAEVRAYWVAEHALKAARR